ncbi:hypothetical protein HDU83_007890 [Entophlyctis luteolus]|nr:hypothetical protein HDU83_007890 [Entophlyctis luteolus]
MLLGVADAPAPAPAPAPASAHSPAPAPAPSPDAPTAPAAPAAPAAPDQALSEPSRSPARSRSPNPLESMFDNDNSTDNANANGSANVFVSKSSSADAGAARGDEDDDEKEEERLRALRNSSAAAAAAPATADSHKESDLKPADGSKSSAKKQIPRSSHYSVAPAAADVKYTPGMIVWAKVKGYPCGWQPHDLLRPFAEFRDELTERGNRTAAFLLAVREGNNPHLLNTLPNNAAVAAPTSSAKKQAKKRRDDEYDGADDAAAADDDDDSRKRRKSSSAAGGEKRGRKKAVSTASSVGVDANGVDTSTHKAASSPPKIDRKDELKTPEEKLKRLRSKLQNFLLKDHSEPDHFSKADRYLMEVEQFAVDVALLLSTKIGKVMRRISEMAIADDKYNIVERSRVVVEKWKLIVDS